MRSKALVALMILTSAAFGCRSNNSPNTDTPTLQQRIQNNELVAYSVVSQPAQGDSRDVWRIAVYDPLAQREISSFEVGDTTESPLHAVPAGNEIVVQFDRRVVAYSMDGSKSRVLHEAREGGYIVAIASSRDGRRLALTEYLQDQCPVLSERCLDARAITKVSAIELSSGNEVFSFGAEGFEYGSFVGAPQALTWRSDSAGLLIEGFLGGEQNSAVATVMLDGTVYDEGLRSFGTAGTSPDGRAIVRAPEPICDGLDLSWERHTLGVDETISKRPLARLSDDVRSLLHVAWSPDGRELLYQTYTLMPNPSRPACPQPDPITVQWFTLDIGSGMTTRAANRYAVEDRWYAAAAVDFRCDDIGVEEPYCPGNGQAAPVDAYVGGTKIASGFHFRLVVTPPRNSVNQ